LPSQEARCCTSGGSIAGPAKHIKNRQCKNTGGNQRISIKTKVTHRNNNIELVQKLHGFNYFQNGYSSKSFPFTEKE
jgi:hypothetical protein